MNTFKKMFSFFWDKSLLFFVIIGGINTVISMSGSFVLNNNLGWTLFASTATMYAITSILSFYFNRKFSFKSKAPLLQSIIRFSIVITVCFLLSFSLTNLVLPWAQKTWFPNISDWLYSIVAILGIQVVFTLLNYIGQRLWAFKE